jgi:hypothetical protein
MHDIDGEQRGPPITRLSDEAWEKVRPLLEASDPPKRLGRKRMVLPVVKTGFGSKYVKAGRGGLVRYGQ